MKRLITLIAVSILILFPALASDPVAQGKTNNVLGNYTVEKSIAPLIVDARILPTYEVSYENSNMIVKIAVDDSNKKCRKFIVVSNDLAIQYNCDGKIFGVSLIEEGYTDDGISNSSINLNRSEFFKQKVLSQRTETELEQIGLISVYFPKLIIEYDKVFAVK